MNMKKAMAIIKASEKREKEGKKKGPKGFMVHYEEISTGGGILTSKHFPDKHAGEKLIKTEKEAWELAKRFAKATDSKRIVNIYITNQNFSPVGGYSDKTIRRLKNT